MTNFLLQTVTNGQTVTTGFDTRELAQRAERRALANMQTTFATILPAYSRNDTHIQ